jgi:hypothetical protein
MVGLIVAEAHLRLSSVIEWLDTTVRVIESIGLGTHLVAYSGILFLASLVFIVWRMTRAYP